jgi:hypothetical protein
MLVYYKGFELKKTTHLSIDTIIIRLVKNEFSPYFKTLKLKL